MWLHLAVLVGLYYLLRWYRETQVVSHIRDKFVFITGCDSGFGNLLARQLDLRGLRVLAACLTEQGAEQLRNETSDRLQTVILDVTKTESVAVATEWVKERVGGREAMWLHLAVLVGLYYLLRWYRERQVVSHLRDKFVFITGCDSGFGNLLARQLDLRGLRVLAGCLTEQGAEQLRNETSDRLQTVILDVTKTESVAAATEWVKERVGDRGLWGLVNNAGICTPMAPNQWLTKQDFVKILEVNLLGVIDVTLNVLPLVRKARGRVVNVSSVMGRVALFGGGYCMSKYGVEAFSDSLRRELCYFGVKVAMIEPGYFLTNMTQDEVFNGNVQASWDHASPEIQELYGDNFLADFMKATDFLKAPWAGNLSLVTDCMEHALTACHPRSRYSAGWDAKLFYLPMSYLPSFLVDLMMYWCSPLPAKAL
ncbi:RDH16 [Cervus elaphus hippelaphus]|uniref:RDH16 n=1 Tax=Cervus elaphus hippelaphus TaxID=46360 RepID=A0A212DF17_CEREH|nr:RDH16 [Cervus elaphus hippelaphus]